MKTCEDCIHFLVCDYFVKIRTETLSSIQQSEDCLFFKDKTKFIELSCSIGDYCIWDDDLWYVNGICYFGPDDFLLWMSMADKSPCGAEAISSEVKFISEEEAKRMLEESNETQ